MASLDVTSRLVLRAPDRQTLRESGPLGELLDAQVDWFLTALTDHRAAQGKPRGPVAACLHDVVPVMSLARPEWFELTPRRICVRGTAGRLETLDDERGRLVTSITDLDETALIDHVLRRITCLDTALPVAKET
jgi:inosine-uridine nucleoside N-ribohydrolase